MGLGFQLYVGISAAVSIIDHFTLRFLNFHFSQYRSKNLLVIKPKFASPNWPHRSIRLWYLFLRYFRTKISTYLCNKCSFLPISLLPLTFKTLSCLRLPTNTFNKFYFNLCLFWLYTLQLTVRTYMLNSVRDQCPCLCATSKKSNSFQENEDDDRRVARKYSSTSSICSSNNADVNGDQVNTE